MPPGHRLITFVAFALLAAPPAAAQLSTAGAQDFAQGENGILGNRESNDRFGFDVAGGDFNGDGRADLAVSSPGESGAKGIVNVIYSNGSFLVSAGNQKWEQGVDGIEGNAENGDQFGIAIEVGDFNQDGFDDLAIGANGEDNAKGAVHVLYGSPQGLSGSGSQVWQQDRDGIRDNDEAGDAFGSSLAVGDFNGDGFPDLAVGSPGENNGEGMVSIIFGSRSGLVTNGNQRWRQGTEGLRGDSERGDQFASSLAAGDFNGDGVDDLIVGTPGENSGKGTINMILGSGGGLTAVGNRRFEQNSDGLPDNREDRDFFGGVLTVGDFNGDGYDDVAAGTIGENGGEGNVIVVPGSAQALNPAASRRWRQGDDGLSDEREGGDRFGGALAAGDFNSDGYDELAVGARGEDGNRGLLHVLQGGADGLTGEGNQVFARGADELSGQALEGDDFAFAVGAANFGGDGADDLAIGAPGVDNDRGTTHAVYGRSIARPMISAVVGAGLSVPPVTAVSYNAILTLFGTNFMPAAAAVGPARVAQGVPTNLNGICVEMDGSRVPIFGAFAGQINIQAVVQPSQTTTDVRVISNCDQPDAVPGDAFTIDVSTGSPEFFFFLAGQDGINPIAAVNETTGALIGAAGLISGATFEAAVEGDVVTLFMTGLGVTVPLFNPGQLPAQAASATQLVTVTIGGVAVEVIYAGVSPGFAGLYQLSFTIPAGLPAGDAPVSVTVGGTTTPPGGFLTLGSPL